ncbi:MAG: ethanolamine ammonia-lyase subunit EutC [Chloroflexaceae bacterium]|jgi:ethanolamine ammonia-lyase small subunit|nr:ethanolamine ammonia-lyase subunit EutC [Chloroflexaceae bacterium]
MDNPNELQPAAPASPSFVTPNPWQSLRRFTNARIALGRAGDSLPTGEMLTFQLDHARARDAVHAPFDSAGLTEQLRAQGYSVLPVQSAAPDRSTYLKRPDLGRRLGEAGRAALASHAGEYDAVFVVADGLSALAVHEHALELCVRAATALTQVGWRLAPVVVASQARVALGDEIGQLLGAEQVAMLIGERPGLSVANSLGVYLTYGPQPGRTDAERNCISNIHGQGLSYEAAAQTLLYLMSEARRLRLTGVNLKDDRAERDAAAQLME